MSWRIVMINHGEYLRLRLDNLYVKSSRNDYTIPLSDISMIIIENLDAVLTSRLMDACAINNVIIVVCDYKHQPCGIYNGMNTHSRASKIIKQQINWDDSFKDSTWKLVVESKIKNQKDVLKLAKSSTKAINLLSEYQITINLGDSSNREGHAAKVYFNELFGMEFTRDLDVLLNACLDYIYAIVRAFFTRLIVGYGYSGMIGIHHKNEYNNFNLADDLMEPFRPLCDSYILTIVKHDSIFDLDMRMSLVDFLHSKIIYDTKKTLMLTAMEKYMHSFIRYCKDGEIEKLIFPEVKFCESIQ